MNFDNILHEKARGLVRNDDGLGTDSNKGVEFELSKIVVHSEKEQTSSLTFDIKEEEGFKELTIQKCENLSNALDYFTSSSINKFLDDTENISLLKFEISEHFPDLNSTELLGLSSKCIRNSIVIIFASQGGQKFSIYWKSNEIEKFMTFKSYDSDFMRTNRTLFEFLAKFLTKSLRNKHLGLRKLDGKHESTEFELHFLADHREFNILLVAAEMGDLAVVEILLKLDISTDSPFKNINAQTLAYQNRHFHVLLMLLQKNLTFPVGMDAMKCSVEVQDFVSMSRKLHELITANDVVKVTELVQHNPHLIYFYNESNESASKVALRSNRPEVYEALLVNEIKFGPHEKVEAIMEELEYETQRAVREIHFRNSKDMSESHLNVLMSNSSVSHDVLNTKEMTSHVQNAFNILNAIPLIRIILMVVAASKKFKIIFDFNRDTVQFVDPTSDGYTNGIFYLSGRIFIGARQLLHDATKNLALATLAHELCHYAINLTYGNDARPYTPNANQSMQKFEGISKYCKENQEKEDVIRLVYDCYPEDMHHAELAVRVAHLMAHYHGQPEKLQQSRENFNGLFEFVEEKLAPEMTKAIPDIESKFDKEIEKKDKEISKLWKFLYLTIIFGVILAALVGFYFYKPTYKFGELSEKQQLNVKNGNVLYKNVNVKLSDLIPGNSMAYGNLTSDHISKLLGNEVLNFDDPLLHYLDKQVVFDWENLAKKLKQKVLGSKFNFQGQIVKFMDIGNLYTDRLMSLTSGQIRTILNGTEIEVGEKVKNEVDFYLERKFIPEDAGMIWFEYAFGHEYISTYYTANQQFISRTGNKSFYEFSDEFFQKSFNDRLKILNEVRDNLDFRGSHFDLNDETFGFMSKNSTEIIEQAKNERILVLSSEAGAGKTVTFEQLAIKMKIMFPTSWVSNIDLKKHTKLYKRKGTSENVQELLQKILNLNSKSKFEKKIFQEAFKSGNVVLLWNGFDEISPTYNEFVLNLIKSIHENTESVQFVCTRPLYSDQLSMAFKVRPWQLISFNETDKLEFLNKLFEMKNLSSTEIDKNIKNVEKFIEKFQFSYKFAYNFNTPLMLSLVAEIYEEGNFSQSPNLYEIFDKFVSKKLKIWLERSQNSDEKAKDVRLVGDLEKIYQKFAILNELGLFSITTLGLKLRKLQIMQLKIPKVLTNAEISGMGILYINGKNEFEFAHKTFSDFFIAKYFIDSIYNADDNISNDEAELRLELFFKLTQSYGKRQTVITDFMSSYLEIDNENENFSDKISELLRTKFKKFFIRMLDTNFPEIFEFLFKFFQKDHKLLADLLHVDQDETFYTAIFNPNYFAQATNPEEIKSLVRNFLTDDEFQKFLNGKNQKGKILFGMHFYGLLGIKKSNKLHDSDVEALNGTSFWEFFNETQGSLTVDEQKDLFVTAASPKIYLFYDEIFNFSDHLDNFNISDNTSCIYEYSKIWNEYENLLTPKEIQNALGDAIIQYFEINPDAKAAHEQFLSFLLDKVDKFLSNSQIYEMFCNKNILHEAHPNATLNDFEYLWNFLSNRTNKDERRNLLLKTDDDDLNLLSFFYYFDKEIGFSSYKYYYSYYDFTKFSILHRSLTKPLAPTFDYTKKIYYEHFNKSEFQGIILSSNDFIFYAIEMLNEKPFGKLMSFLEELFEGNEKSLKNLFNRKVKPTKLSVLDYIEDFRGLPSSLPIWFENLKILSDFYDKLIHNL